MISKRGTIWAIDFDDTLSRDNYPLTGEPIQKNIDFVKKLREDGAKLVLWTCREGEALENAVKWCAEKGIIFDAVNANIPEVMNGLHREDSRKIKAHYYFDDKAVNPYTTQLK